MSRRKEFPIQLFDPEVVRQVDAEVERLFRDMPRKCGTNCVNPVTGGWYVAGLDPVKPQKEKARRALLAREHFSLYGPADAQPLPLSSDEIDEMACRGHLITRVVRQFARSLLNRGYDIEEHPSFSDYASGLLWEMDRGNEFIPDYPPNEDAEVRKRYPPRRLEGIGCGARWLPPKLHAERQRTERQSMARDAAIARLRAESLKADVGNV